MSKDKITVSWNDIEKQEVTGIGYSQEVLPDCTSAFTKPNNRKGLRIAVCMLLGLIVLGGGAGAGIWFVYATTDRHKTDQWQRDREGSSKDNLDSLLSKQTADEIQNVLILNSKYIQIMEAAAPTGETINEEFNNAAKIIRNYTKQAKAIDLSRVPNEFAAAYYRHLSAWEEFATAFERCPLIPSLWDSLLEGALRGLAGDPTGGYFEKEAAHNEYTRELEARHDQTIKTWREVVAIAIQHGARTTN